MSSETQSEASEGGCGNLSSSCVCKWGVPTATPALPKARIWQTLAPPGLSVPTRGLLYTRPTNVCLQPHPLQYFLISMGLCISTTSPRQPTGRIGQGAICGACQVLRYAPFPSYAYWSVSKHRPWVTDHVLRRSTCSMMIPSFTYSIFTGPFF
jgi:hypothetical protein